MFVTQLRPTAPVKAGGARALERALLVIGVAALGYNLRGAITSLPPVFPELQDRLGLSVGVRQLSGFNDVFVALSASDLNGTIYWLTPWAPRKPVLVTDPARPTP